MTRKNSLDFLKFICAFMVVCIHITFPEPFKSIIAPFSRIAVPIFFIITGYFYSFTKERNRELLQIKKIGVLFVFSNIVYLLYSLFKSFLKKETIVDFFYNIFNAKTFVNFIFLNESPLGVHLWYLNALLYILILIYFFEKKWNRKFLYPTIPILLLINLILGKYSILILGNEFPEVWTRNFLFLGLPYFLIGDLIFKMKQKLNYPILIFSTIIFSCTAFLEDCLLNNFNLNLIRDIYFSTTFLAISVFLLTLNSKDSNTSRIYHFCCFIGNKLSLSIYLLHPIFIGMLSIFISVFVHNDLVYIFFDYLSPLIVFCISLAVSGILYIVENIIKEKQVTL